MFILSVVELVVSIWSAALCCRAAWRCCKTRLAGLVVQASLRPRQNPQQQVIVYPGSGAGQLSIAHEQPAIQKLATPEEGSGLRCLGK